MSLNCGVDPVVHVPVAEAVAIVGTVLMALPLGAWPGIFTVTYLIEGDLLPCTFSI